jgi:hypothetical protein
MSHHALIQRSRAEYLEMPGLRLTLAQAQRFCGVDSALCERTLSELVDLKFLCIKPDGTYARVVDGVDRPHPYPVKAGLASDRRSQRAS